MLGWRPSGAALVMMLVAGTVAVPAAPAAAAPLAPMVLPVDHIGGKAWGPGEDGQIGDGVPFSSPVPIDYAGLTSGVRHISTGGLHTLVALADGTVRASGYNGSGELGDGTFTERLTAVPVVGLTSVVQVSAGGNYSLALRADGTVWAWGSNLHGQLGDGTTTQRLTPVQVVGLTSMTQIAAGDGDTSVALRGDGTVWTWGHNFLGQIGDGTTTNRPSPVQVPGLTGVQQISTYGYSSLVLRNDGTVWGWGYNGEGELGDGTQFDRHTPVQVPGLTGVRQVSSNSHAVAVMNDGTVRGWGFNDRGQIGDGTVGTNRLSPVVLPNLTGVTRASAGVYHALALRSDGTVRAWGWNLAGQLGDGTHTTRTTAVPVPGLTNVTLVGAARSSVAVVALPYFTIATTPSAGTLHGGALATTLVRLTALNGFTAAATLSASGLPAGATATFSPTTVSAAVPTSTLTLRTSLGTPAGTYPITVTATSAASVEPVKTLTYTLTVINPPADFSVSLSEPFGFAYGGASDSTLVQLNPINGFAETMSVFASTKGLPTGMSVSLSAAHAAANAPVTLTVSTTFDTPEGTYFITVTGAADDPLTQPSHTTTYQFTVGPPIG